MKSKDINRKVILFTKIKLKKNFYKKSNNIKAEKLGYKHFLRKMTDTSFSVFRWKIGTKHKAGISHLSYKNVYILTFQLLSEWTICKNSFLT